jgi:hypothetical protein
LLAREMDFAVLHIVQTGSAIYSAYYTVDSGVSFSEGKAVRI